MQLKQQRQIVTKMRDIRRRWVTDFARVSGFVHDEVNLWMLPA